VSGPVIAVGLVLSAVFVPCAFISGITGHFFRQFALTIAVSTIISAFNSLTLSPALTALFLRPLKDSADGKEKPPPLPRLAFALAGGWLGWEFLGPLLTAWLNDGLFADLSSGLLAILEPTLLVVAILAGVVVGWLVSAPLNRLLSVFFGGFNRGFRRATSGYVRLVGGILRVSVVMLVIYGGLLALTYFRFLNTPKGFIPAQDMGYLMVNVQLPDSASMERTDKVMRQIEGIATGMPGVWHVTTISGSSFVLNANGSNFGSVFINLKPYPERRTPDLSSDAIANNLRMACNEQIKDAMVAVFGPPPVRGVGRAGGFTIMIEDRGDLGARKLQDNTDNLVRLGNQPDKEQTPWLLDHDDKSRLVGLFSVFRSTVPQLRIQPDASACMIRGVSMLDFANTLQVYTGSLYVNDFNLFGRTWQVIVQAEANFRDRPESISQLQVRNSRGAMVPLGSLAEVRDDTGPLVLTRYNMYPAAGINGSSAPGVSSGDTITMLQRLAERELPQAMKHEWTDMSYLELQAGNTAMIIFGFAVIMVFLVLAAQYESWSLPLAVILVVPMCVLSAITGVNIAGMDINIFTQIGFVVLVGLASKNAILIVEFAKQQRHEGKSRTEATLEACKLRLRPIIMTSLAFILGVLPLIISTGAGAEMRRTLGTAVFSGMLGVTLFGIVLTPVFFFTIDWLGDTRLFHSRLAHRLGNIALDVVALRSVRKAAAHVMRSVKKQPIPVQVNGQVHKERGRQEDKETAGVDHGP
ncbi:MAG TPA: efflux RND transporter permease subunit, partial [Gemmataceae bacterium]|nr:efflux RND transporter permease subunit [Gemmataceae bacterium]